MDTMIILCDIDHTIANSFWRDSMIGGDWDVYHESSQFDKPFENMITLLNSLADLGYTNIGITGRPEKFRKLTMDWLIGNNVDIHELLMRSDDNFEKNAVCKVNLIKKRFGNDLKKIHFYIDDNQESAIEVWKLGIITLQIRNVP